MPPTFTNKVLFYFDPISPYAWLASKEFSRLQLSGIDIEVRPILFAALLNANGQKGPAEIPSKRAYIFRDVMRIAERSGYSLLEPPTHPFNPLKALRLCIAVEAGEKRNRLCQAVLNAAWEEGKDLNDLVVLQNITRQCQLETLNLLSLIETPSIKHQLTVSTQKAIDLQIFGVPTFVYNDELFWGSDRIDDLLWRHTGHNIDETILAQCLSRGATARRK